MARTTISDILSKKELKMESRYEVGMLASQRVRDLNGGAEAVVEKNNDKMTVVALREIASGKLNVDTVRHEFVQSYKDAPSAEAGEETLEVGSENPELRVIDAELDDVLTEETSAVVESDDEADSDNGDDAE